jgi:hypothetical protein
MQLKRIQDLLSNYKDFLRGKSAHERLYAWASQRIFQENWSLDASDFKTMYDHSLENSQTRRLWKRENYEPKRMMLNFIDLSEDMVRHAFQDLFDEEKEIDGRVGRFVFYCDELLRHYKEAHPHSVENNHYHNHHYQMISLYLAFRFPDRYTLYDGAKFKKMLHLVGSADIPEVDDFGRFCKVMRTLYTFLQRDEELMTLHQKRLSVQQHYTAESLLVVWDFYHFCTS